MENIIGEFAEKKSFLGLDEHPPMATGTTNATQPDLQARQPVGNGVTGAVYHGGETMNASVRGADTTNSTTTLNTTASEENRSKKFKNPQVKQSGGMLYSDQK